MNKESDFISIKYEENISLEKHQAGDIIVHFPMDKIEPPKEENNSEN
jgi:hypothetical protein